MGASTENARGSLLQIPSVLSIVDKDDGSVDARPHLTARAFPRLDAKESWLLLWRKTDRGPRSLMGRFPETRKEDP